MSTLKEMAAEYREAAAKLAMAIEAHKKAGDLLPEELTQLQTTLHDVRAVAHLLAGYYDVSRPPGPFTLTDLHTRRTRDDH